MGERAGSSIKPRVSANDAAIGTSLSIITPLKTALKSLTRGKVHHARLAGSLQVVTKYLAWQDNSANTVNHPHPWTFCLWILAITDQLQLVQSTVVCKPKIWVAILCFNEA